MQLPRQTQARVYADFILAHETKEQASRRDAAAKRRRLDRILKERDLREY